MPGIYPGVYVGKEAKTSKPTKKYHLKVIEDSKRILKTPPWIFAVSS